MKARDAVIFADGQREEHNALVTTVWIWTEDTINVVYISSNEAETEYDRQFIITTLPQGIGG